MAYPTYQTILDGARVLLNDTDDPEEEGQRYPDSVLVGILNRALSELSRLRPDAFFDMFNRNDLNLPTIVAGDTAEEGEKLLSDEFPLDRMFHPPLIAYVAGMAEASDDEFTVDGRVIVLLERFRAQLLSV